MVTGTTVVERVLDTLEDGLVGVAVSTDQRDELARVAEGMRRVLGAEHDRNLLCVHLPALVAVGLGAPDAAADAAAAVSTLVYAAARIVDDAMDGQPMTYAPQPREGVLGLAVALCAAAYRMITEAPLTQACQVGLVREVSGTILAMADGQLADVRGFGHTPAPTIVLASVGRKSGAMLAGFARCGALVASADAGVLEACGELGEAAGVARQLAADLHELERGGGADARNGAATLPVALHLAGLDPAAVRAFHTRYRASASSTVAHAALLAELGASGALASAGLYAEVAVGRAHRALDRLHLDGEAHVRLASLLDIHTHP